MVNKVYNSESKKYNSIPKLDAIGSYILYENGLKEYLLTIPLTDGLATTASIGSFARTSHSTGRGEVFSSDGSQWVHQTGGGLGASIGGIVTGSTAGSVPYIGTSSVLAEDNINFFWDAVTKTLKLGNKNYNVAVAGWAGFSYFQIGNNTTPYVIPNNGQGYGSKIDFYSTATSGYVQSSGIRVRANLATNGGDGTVTGVESFVTNRDSSTNTDVLQGVEGIAQAIQNVSTVYAGYFSANASSGGTGNTLGDLIGVRSIVSSFNQFTTTNVYAFYGSLSTSNGPVTNAYGLFLDNFGSTAATNSYGIYLDSSIDVGTSSKYAIYSLSTSPSILTGNLTINGTGKFFITNPQTPASATATGTTGQVAWDSNYIYVCVATNTWKRTPISTW